MNRISFLSLGIFFICQFSYGQSYTQFIGKVVDESNRALVAADVRIPAIKKGAITDTLGVFVIEDVLEGTYDIEIYFLGYEPLKKSVLIKKGQESSFQLTISSVKFEELLIEDDYADQIKKETALDIEVVDEDYLKEHLGGSLMKSLERLPGVTTIDIGSGQSKPVIRGLSFNRVVVVENNIKHEAQQWGADHGLEIDQYAVDHVEIIKGPASLMYGSDAIGGIINMSNKSLPAENTYGMTIDLSGKTNNDFLGGSISLFGRKKSFFITARATLTDYADFRVPTDSVDIYNYRVGLYKNRLRNTAGHELNLHSSFGIIKKRFISKFYVSNVRMQAGFFANAHGLEPRNVDEAFHDASSRDIQYPFQKVNHFKLINKSSYWAKTWRLEFDLGYQRNYREEWSQYVQHGYMPALFPDTMNFNGDIERQFQKDIYAANLKFFYQISENTELSSGINSEYKQNEIGGRGFIIPAYQQLNLGSFAVLKHHFSEKSLLQGGLRYDYGYINTKAHNDWFPSPADDSNDSNLINLPRAIDIERNFSNLTWSVGYNYNAEHWSSRVNIGNSFRMPIPKELAANGINYHRFSYEVGNADLSPEISYQLDAGVDYQSKKLAIGLSPFLSYFSNYIYLNPTANYDRLYGFGNQIFEYTEAEVFRWGAEIYANYDVLEYLQLGFVGEYVYALQLSGPKAGFTLPFAPPASCIFNIRYHKDQIAFMENPYVSLDYRLTATQRNIVPPEVVTPGFQVINLSIGADILFKNQPIDIALQVQNLLNSKFFNHTSYYRLINVPEAGRNFVLNISIPFVFKTP